MSTLSPVCLLEAVKVSTACLCRRLKANRPKVNKHVKDPLKPFNYLSLFLYNQEMSISVHVEIVKLNMTF